MRFSFGILLSFACAASFLATPPGRAQAPASPTAENQTHYPTNEDLRQLKSLTAPLLSPDGKLVLFTVTEATADGGASHLWLAPTPAGHAATPSDNADKARQITFSPPSDKRGERGAQWAPDGSAIYFLAKRGEHTQLYRLDLRGGEGQPYEIKVMPAVDESKEKGAIPPPGAEPPSPTDKIAPAKPDEKAAEKKANAAPEPLELEVGGYAPSPDGKWLAVWGRDPETPGEKKQKDAKADAEWVNHDLHGTRVYLAALKPNGSVDGSLKPVAIEPDVHSVYWSPLSDRLLAITEKPNGASDLGPAGAAWLVETSAPEKPSKLDGIPATVGRGAAWRPDGKEIAFAALTPEDAPPGYDELFALPLDPSDAVAPKPRRLSAGFAGQLNGSVLFYTANNAVIAEAGLGTRLTPVKIALDGNVLPQPVDFGSPLIEALTSNHNQTGWAWIDSQGGEAEKLCFAARFGEPCRPVDLPQLAATPLQRVKPQLIQWKSGGFTIEGLLYLPPGSGSTKLPLIVDVHGGPFGAFEDRNDAFAAFLIGHGWAVLRPNPRGSANYGVKFAAANKNDLGGGDYQDIMAGVDAALARFPLDPQRMALIGYSYGGEMAGFVEGKTDRFKAVVSGAPVIDQFSEYGTESDSWYDRWYFGKPWEHLDDAWKQSPLAGTAHAKTPFMLLQGQSDTTDPLGQSEEMYRALRQEGVPVELITYPREDHGPLAMGIFGRPSPEPWHGLDARKRMVEFIEKAFTPVPGHP